MQLPLFQHGATAPAVLLLLFCSFSCFFDACVRSRRCILRSLLPLHVRWYFSSFPVVLSCLACLLRACDQAPAACLLFEICLLTVRRLARSFVRSLALGGSRGACFLTLRCTLCVQVASVACFVELWHSTRLCGPSQPLGSGTDRPRLARVPCPAAPRQGSQRMSSFSRTPPLWCLRLSLPSTLALPAGLSFPASDSRNQGRRSGRRTGRL
jgi:hypothetical protein